ncbi:MAG: DUF5716 family protein [Defluviitaleaceae bacterium]|nr:DUF5716 family protein [Defluviitaleaceae bacterium]
MHWKRYRDLPNNEKYNETYYIIGLDIGNDSTGIAFYNLYENAPEPIDPSGGYGKPTIPTVMQYITETKEWVFGEYAILNQGAGTEITLQSLTRRLGQLDYQEIGGKPVSVVSLMGMFIRELLASLRNINPKAEIVGIVAAVPAYLSEGAHEELLRAFKYAGYEKELIALVPDRECVLAHHFQNSPPRDDKVLLLDYGSREVRGGVYVADKNMGVKSLSSIFDDTLGTGMIDEDVYGLFESYYNAVQDNSKGSEASTHDNSQEYGVSPPHRTPQLTAFTYQHKDILFQKNIRTKPAKLYFNFVYPPFQQTVTHSDTEMLIKPYRQQFSRFIQDTLEKTIATGIAGGVRPKAISPHDISSVVCVGGGFEMLWAREEVSAVFTQSQIRMYKNAKLVTAEGAALVAAKMLKVTKGYNFTVEDRHQLPVDIGISTGDVFLPLAAMGTFWWQKRPPTLMIVNSPVNGEMRLTLVERTVTGESRHLAGYNLTGLPTRPKGTTRLKFGLSFKSNTDIALRVEDLGFGELFPKTGYSGEFVIKLA